MLTLVATLLVFCLVVVVHEFGHFAVAKISGVKVNEFAIGMGPKIIGKKRGETEYSLRAIPLGGFVRMEGEDESSDDARSFNNKPVASRMAIILAGAFMNFVLAFAVFTIYYASTGTYTAKLDEVKTDYPAYQAGIRSGDEIVEIEGKKVDSWNEIYDRISSSDSKSLSIKADRDGQLLTFEVEPKLEDGKSLIGITPRIEKSLATSVKQSGSTLVTMVEMMFEFIGGVFTGAVSTDEVSGPVGVFHLIGEATKSGFMYLLFITGFISVNLGFFNLLPIPALDGSRFVFLLVEAVRGKKMDPEKEGLVHIIGFVLLIALTIFITYKDILKFSSL